MRARNQVFGVIASVVLTASLTFSARAALIISTAPTQNVVCKGHLCIAKAQHAVLNVDDLANRLAASDIKVQTQRKKNINRINIRVVAPLSWTAKTTLTLKSLSGLIEINAPIVVAGRGNLNLFASRGYTFSSGKGSISFWDNKSLFVANNAHFQLVGTLTELATKISVNPKGFYAFARDYDAEKDGIYSKSPVTTPFTGNLEGLGNTISNLTIRANIAGNYGLLERNDGQIINLDMTHALVSGTDSNLGGFAGTNTGGVLNSSFAGTIQSTHGGYAGGIVGENEGEIYSCHAKGFVSGADASGGVVGNNFGSFVERSNSTAAVSAGIAAGGLVGVDNTGIDSSWATGAVSSGRDAGGLVGENYFGGPVSNSYARGIVTAKENAGGLIGQTDHAQSVAFTYSTGAPSGAHRIGGFIGTNYMILTSDYWDVDTSATETGVAKGYRGSLQGLKDQQLKSELPSGFDNRIWALDPKINNGYPYLIANPPPK